MGGYVTIAPDLPGKCVWPQQRADQNISRDSVAASLVEMVKVVDVQQPIHLVGCGFGAYLAWTVRNEYSRVIISAAISAERDRLLNFRAAEELLVLSGSAPKEERMQAFNHFFMSNGETTTLLRQDVEEYAEAFSDPSNLSNMQMAYKSIPADLNTISASMAMLPEVGSLSLSLDEIPEGQSEQFALSILSFINSHNGQTNQNILRPLANQNQKQSRL